jgi:hypothetical protein
LETLGALKIPIISFFIQDGKKKRFDPASFLVERRITRSISNSHNILVLELHASMADSRIDRLEHQFSSLLKMTEETHSQIAATNSKVDSLISREDNNMSRENSNAKSKGKNHSGSSNSATPKIMKLNFPRYGGDGDPSSWICGVEQFFEYQ